MKNFIYGVFDPITKELRYIGQTCKGKLRFSRHIKAAQHKKQPIACYIKSLLVKNLKPSSIRSVLQGKAKSIKGFFFKYQEVKNA